jgi:hypothetical protein
MGTAVGTTVRIVLETSVAGRSAADGPCDLALKIAVQTSWGRAVWCVVVVKGLRQATSDGV